MLSSMTPTIIEKEGELYMVVGTPGGSTIITSVELMDKAIATSGPYQRFFNDLIHSKGGRPAQEIASSTIITEKAIDADVLATAFFILGSRKGMKLLNKFRGARALYVNNEGHFIRYTSKRKG